MILNLLLFVSRCSVSHHIAMHISDIKSIGRLGHGDSPTIDTLLMDDMTFIDYRIVIYK